MTLSQIIEALIFANPEPLSTRELARAVREAARSMKAGEGGGGGGEEGHYARVGEEDVEGAISELSGEYERSGRAFTLVERPAGWRVMTRPDYSDWVRGGEPGKRPARLSAPALETLAIVAYRQPITKANIEAVRGVAVDGVMQTLIDRNLVRITGRADLPGRPLLYETTESFLEHFGIRSVHDLPNAAELRRIELPTAGGDGGEAGGAAEGEVAEQPELFGGGGVADGADGAEVADEAEVAEVAEVADGAEEEVDLIGEEGEG